MSKQKQNIVKWLTTAKRLPTRRCISCEEPWKSAISEVLDEMASGRAGRNVTFSGLWRYLTDTANFDPIYPLSVESLRAHVRAHCTDQYREWVRRGR